MTIVVALLLCACGVAAARCDPLGWTSAVLYAGFKSDCQERIRMHALELARIEARRWVNRRTWRGCVPGVKRDGVCVRERARNPM